MKVRVRPEAVDALAAYRMSEGEVPRWELPEEGEYVVLDIPEETLEEIALGGYDYESPEDLTEFFIDACADLGSPKGGDA